MRQKKSVFKENIFANALDEIGRKGNNSPPLKRQLLSCLRVVSLQNNFLTQRNKGVEFAPRFEAGSSLTR